MAEEDFSAQSKHWASKIAHKFGDKAGEQFLDVVLDLFESTEELLADLEVEEWDESALVDTLNSDKNAYHDANLCATFYKTLKVIIDGQDTLSADIVLLPSDIRWDIEEKELIKAKKYMHMQCPGGGFYTSAENKNLFKIIAVGIKNQIELLTLIMDIYELAHIDEIVAADNEKRGFQNETAWAAKCEFFKTYNKSNSDVIRRAIPEFKKRISGGGAHEMILNPIEDNINVYIQYVLILQGVIKNILDTNKENICPAQIDLVILGRKHKNDDGKVDDDDDDDDEDDFLAKINDELNSSGDVPLVNKLPDYGLIGILQKKKIDFITEKISVSNIAKTSRTIQEKIEYKLRKAKESGQRIIVCIDRSGSGADAFDEKEAENDDLFVYQLGDEWDKINKDYNEMHLVWKTKNALMPNWKMDDDDLNAVVGGSSDIGDKGFAFSFHIHSSHRIYCDQWIKSQEMPFLPYHLIDVWPLYFHKDFRKIDKTFNYQYIYENWKLQTNDVRLNKWIEIIDPDFYQNLEKKHFKYMQK